jgi:hypothetical protein
LRSGTPLLVCALSLVVLRVGVVVRDGWRNARGYEYEWVAGALAAGQGYSFDRHTAWLGPYSTEAPYTPTAWVEPLHTVLASGCFRLFGEGGRLVLVLLNLVWFAGTGVLIYRCCASLSGPAAAIPAVALFVGLLLHESGLFLYIGNVALASFLFMLCVKFLIGLILERQLRAALMLGITIGLSNLTHAGSLLFGVVAAGLVLLAGRCDGRHFVAAALIVLLPLLVISPWTIRNVARFRELTPVRTGMGLMLNIGNPALARTIVDPHAVTAAFSPPWTASTARDAVRRMRNLPYERAIRYSAIQHTTASAPPQYASYNEAQRDRYFGSVAWTYMRSNSFTTARLAFWKSYEFWFGWGLISAAVTICALIGFVLYRHDLRVLAVLSLCVIYALPYTLTLPVYYRYRAPVEPLICIGFGLLAGCVTRYAAARDSRSGQLVRWRTQSLAQR